MLVAAPHRPRFLPSCFSDSEQAKGGLEPGFIGALSAGKFSYD
jgi:hypothetical protein